MISCDLLFTKVRMIFNLRQPISYFNSLWSAENHIIQNYQMLFIVQNSMLLNIFFLAHFLTIFRKYYASFGFKGFVKPSTNELPEVKEL